MIDSPYTIKGLPVIKNNKDLGAWVKQCRHMGLQQSGKKLPLQTLAELAGVSRDTLYRLEKGEEVSFTTVISVLRVFGLGFQPVPVEWPTLDTAREYFQSPGP